MERERERSLRAGPVLCMAKKGWRKIDYTKCSATETLKY